MELCPDTVQNVSEACEQYRRREVSEEQLQQCVWNAVQLVVAIEDKELRTFLKRAEGKLELLRFTVDSARLYEESLAVVAEIERRLGKSRTRFTRRWLSEDPIGFGDG